MTSKSPSFARVSTAPAPAPFLAPSAAPSGMQVKAQAFLNAIRFLEQTHGNEALAAIIRRCSPAVRERYISGIAIEWHPLEEFLELLHVSQDVLGGPYGEVAKQMGAEGARINTRGMAKRALTYVASAEFLLKRIASLWSQFNDRGNMAIRSIDREGAVIELADLPRPDELHCATITGWCEVIGDVVGFRNAKAEHTSCRARGDHACLWTVRYARVAED